VVGNKNLTEVTKPSEIVQLLLNDEQLASFESSNHLPTADGGQNGDKDKQTVVRDMWNDDGDDFFGHTVTACLDRVDDNIGPGPSQATRGKGRKAGASRGRKPGPKKKGLP
jgi:DNA helicase INO80